MSATREPSDSSARLADATNALERQRDEWMRRSTAASSELEADVRRRLEDLGADAEAERAVLEARLQELVPAVRRDRRPPEP